MQQPYCSWGERLRHQKRKYRTPVLGNNQAMGYIFFPQETEKKKEVDDSNYRMGRAISFAEKPAQLCYGMLFIFSIKVPAGPGDPLC